ncbi:MAG: helix-turn-helix domain-containing protein [Pseudomonadota bacterium]
MSELDYRETTIQEPTPPGAVLRAAREAAGMSVLDVAQALKLSPRQVEAIEADDYERLSGPTFVRGFIRNYAKLLRLDAADLLASLDGKAQLSPVELRVPEHEGVRMPSGAERPTRAWTVASLLAAVLLVVAVILYFDLVDVSRLLGQGGTRQAIAPPAPAPAAAPPAPVPAAAPEAPAAQAALPANAAVAPAESGPAPADPAQRRLVFTFQGDSWVEVREASGQIIFSQLNHKGTTQVVEGRAPLSLVIGNANAVRLVANEQPVDLAPHTRVEVARLSIE